MNYYKIFYWLTRLEALQHMLVAGIVIFAAFVAVSIIIWVACAAEGDEIPKWTYRSRRWSVPLLVFFVIAYVAIPSKTDCMLIIAGGAVGNFITSDSSAKAIPSDITNYLHKALNKEVEEMSTDAKKELGLQTPKETLIDKAKDMTKEQLIEYLKTDTTINVTKSH